MVAAVPKRQLRLIVDGKPVRSASGTDNERLRAHNWRVDDLAGKKAHLEIVDAASGPWGHINIDQIEMRDTPMGDAIADVREQPDYGTMGLALVEGADQLASGSLPAVICPVVLFDEGKLATEGPDGTTIGAEAPRCAGQDVETGTRPGSGRDVRRDLVSAQHDHARPEGRKPLCQSVSQCLCRGRLRDGQPGSTGRETPGCGTTPTTIRRLPYWLLDRLHSTVGNLATTTCQWWANGRFWAWEGCGCCHGTCGHVWNYEHAMARLFPRAGTNRARNAGFCCRRRFRSQETGEIRFRGEGWGIWAGDSQGGYVLKAYREHQTLARRSVSETQLAAISARRSSFSSTRTETPTG